MEAKYRVQKTAETRSRFQLHSAKSSPQLFPQGFPLKRVRSTPEGHLSPAPSTARSSHVGHSRRLSDGRKNVEEEEDYDDDSLSVRSLSVDNIAGPVSTAKTTHGRSMKDGGEGLQTERRVQSPRAYFKNIKKMTLSMSSSAIPVKGESNASSDKVRPRHSSGGGTEGVSATRDDLGAQGGKMPRVSPRSRAKIAGILGLDVESWKEEKSEGAEAQKRMAGKNERDGEGGESPTKKAEGTNSTKQENEGDREQEHEKDKGTGKENENAKGKEKDKEKEEEEEANQDSNNQASLVTKEKEQEEKAAEAKKDMDKGKEKEKGKEKLQEIEPTPAPLQLPSSAPAPLVGLHDFGPSCSSLITPRGPKPSLPTAAPPHSSNAEPSRVFSPFHKNSIFPVFSMDNCKTSGPFPRRVSSFYGYTASAGANSFPVSAYETPPPTFSEIFILTYRTVATPYQMIKALLRR